MAWFEIEVINVVDGKKISINPNYKMLLSADGTIIVVLKPAKVR